MKVYFAIIILLVAVQLTHSQSLERRASWDASIDWPDNVIPGATIRELSPSSALYQAGLREGDRILKVNDRSILHHEDWSAVTYAIRSENSTKIEFKRDNEWKAILANLSPLEREIHEGIKTTYGEIVSDYGIRQRTIVTTPDPNKKLPAIFLIQGLSCSTIEKYSGRSNNWVRLINDLVEKSGMVVMRVDKPGVGDSEGDCGSTDFITELNGYESALRKLLSMPNVDTSRIVVYGNSMGSAIAPYLVNKYDLAGVISDGTFFRTWYEHMLEIERRILIIEGNSESEIHQKMNQYFIPLYHGMLIEKKSFAAIMKAQPALGQFHRQGLNHMYGRPMEYYHQVQDFDFAKAWEEINAPVRIRWGTNDWIMSEADNQMIIDLLERRKHEDHKLFKYPNMDHWSTIHESYSNSFYGKTGMWEDQISQQIIDWAIEMTGK